MKLFLAILFLAVILVIIAFLIVLKKSKKTIQTQSSPKQEKSLEFEDLFEIVKNPNTSSNDLFNVIQLFDENFKIDEKNPQKYFIFFSRLLTHQNVNKDIFQYFHKHIKKNNPNFKNSLENLERKALG